MYNLLDNEFDRNGDITILMGNSAASVVIVAIIVMVDIIVVVVVIIIVMVDIIVVVIVAIIVMVDVIVVVIVIITVFKRSTQSPKIHSENLLIPTKRLAPYNAILPKTKSFFLSISVSLSLCLCD